MPKQLPWPPFLATLLAIILWSFSCRTTGKTDGESTDSATDALECSACAQDCLFEYQPVDDADHVGGGLDYEDTPPTGGNHDPCWAEWGVHTVEVPDENWVHNLEHGGVVLLYNCTDCAEAVSWMTGFAALHPGKTLVSPYSLMDWPFAVISWEHRLLMGCFEAAAIETFFTENYGNAPELATSMPSDSCME